MINRQLRIVAMVSVQTIAPRASNHANTQKRANTFAPIPKNKVNSADHARRPAILRPNDIRAKYFAAMVFAGFLNANRIITWSAMAMAIVVSPTMPITAAEKMPRAASMAGKTVRVSIRNVSLRRAHKTTIST